MKRLLLLLAIVVPAYAQNPATAQFPGAVASDSQLLCWENNGTTAINGAINDSTLTITVDDGTKLCAPGTITIDSEIILIDSISTNTLTVNASGRGYDGSTAASHSDDAAVNQYVTKYWLHQIAAEIKAIQTKLTANLGSTTFGGGSAITHTFDASAGTDCSIAYGDNTVTFTCGTVSFGSGTGVLEFTEGSAPGAGSSAGKHKLYFRSDTSRLCAHENGSSEVCFTLGSDFDTSSELAGILGDETGSGAAVFGTSPTIATPVLTGKIDRNNVSVDDDDCTGEQGLYWYDTTDSQFEFCNANSGTPTTLGGGGSSPYQLLSVVFGRAAGAGSGFAADAAATEGLSLDSGVAFASGSTYLTHGRPALDDTEGFAVRGPVIPSGITLTNLTVYVEASEFVAAVNNYVVDVQVVCLASGEASPSVPADATEVASVTLTSESGTAVAREMIGSATGVDISTPCNTEESPIWYFVRDDAIGSAINVGRVSVIQP